MKIPIRQTLGKIGNAVGSYFSNGYNGQYGVKQNTSPQVLQHIQNQKAAGDVQTLSKIKGYKKGGKVKQTGLAYLHKGEFVVPKNKVKKLITKL